MTKPREYIVDFLRGKGWHKEISGRNHEGYFPPKALELPDQFKLLIPFDDESEVFKDYFDNLINNITNIYEDYSNQELSTILTSNDVVMSMRVMDKDTIDGTIGLDKYAQKITHLRNIIREATTFAITHKAIFSKTPPEAKDFIKHCKNMQSEKGSFVTRIKIPFSVNINSHIDDPVNTEDVINKISQSMNIITNVAPKVNTDTIDNVFISEYKDLINIELLNQIKNMYSTAKINNAELSFSDTKEKIFIETKDMTKKIKTIEAFLNKTKDVLMNKTPLEASGIIKKLESSNSDHSNTQVEITAIIDNKKKTITATLGKQDYIKAIDAHKEGLKVFISGLAGQRSNSYYIKDIIAFEVG